MRNEKITHILEGINRFDLVIWCKNNPKDTIASISNKSIFSIPLSNHQEFLTLIYNCNFCNKNRIVIRPKYPGYVK